MSRPRTREMPEFEAWLAGRVAGRSARVYVRIIDAALKGQRPLVPIVERRDVRAALAQFSAWREVSDQPLLSDLVRGANPTAAEALSITSADIMLNYVRPLAFHSAEIRISGQWFRCGGAAADRAREILEPSDSGMRGMFDSEVALGVDLVRSKIHLRRENEERCRQPSSSPPWQTFVPAGAAMLHSWWNTPGRDPARIAEWRAAHGALIFAEETQ